MDRFETVSIQCSCGASLRQVDFAHRTAEAEGEFRAQHAGEFHVVSEADPAYSDECILCGKSDTAGALCADCQVREDRVKERIDKRVLACLYRLKARLGKTRAHCLRVATGEGRDLALLLRGKAGAVLLAMEFVDREISRTKGED
jgi:hypothetical protein